MRFVPAETDAGGTNGSREAVSTLGNDHLRLLGSPRSVGSEESRVHDISIIRSDASVFGFMKRYPMSGPISESAKKIGICLAAALMVAGCASVADSGAAPTRGSSESAAAGETAAAGTAAAVTTPAATPAPTGPKTYKIGETATVQRDNWGLKITVSDVKVVATYGSGKYLVDKPQVAGNVFIQAKVSYEAVTDGADYSTADWELYCDGTAVTYSAFVIYGPKPDLGTGTLITGRKAAGYVVYEVPKKGEVRLSYKAVMFDTAPTFEVVIRAS